MAQNPRPLAMALLLLWQSAMNEPRPLKFYGYVDRPYGAVRDLLRLQPDDLLKRATLAASERASGLVARLHVGAGGADVGVDVQVKIRQKPDDAAVAGLPEVAHLALTWHAARGEGLFPTMSGELSASPVTFADTQIGFEGTYQPPLGGFGKAVDALIGHRIAEATVHRFVNEVVGEIRRALPPSG